MESLGAALRRPLAGVRELEESLAEEMTAHDELLLRVERDTRVELLASIVLTFGLPLLAGVLLLALRKRFLLPLDQLRDLMRLPARQERVTLWKARTWRSTSIGARSLPGERCAFLESMPQTHARVGGSLRVMGEWNGKK